MGSHKNDNNAIGNYAIYSIDIYDELHKIGKADDDRKTKSTKLPTRLHQQVRKAIKKHGDDNVDFDILELLKNVSTKTAKEREKEILQIIFEATGEVPEGNQKSFRPKK